MTPFTLFSLFSNDKKASPEIFFGNAHKLSKPIFFIYIEFTPYSPCTLISHTSYTSSRSRASPYIHKQKNTRRRANSPPSVFYLFMHGSLPSRRLLNNCSNLTINIAYCGICSVFSSILCFKLSHFVLHICISKNY